MTRNQNKLTQPSGATLAKMQEALPEELLTLLDQAKNLEKWPIARLISIFERNTEANFIARHQIMSHIDTKAQQFNKHAMVLGITGTPGAGKSSLIGELCLSLLKSQPSISIAVLAIDPSSHNSGGALLGDRTRTIFPVNDKRLFFRSQASQLDLGGMSKRTFHVTRLLRKLFDIIIIETVGIGQNEIEIQHLSDHTCLVMQPLAGDQVQFMKAGIMEVPDTFIINKCDEDKLAKKSLHLLKSSLKLASIHIESEASQPKNIFLTSAIKRSGIEELAQFVFDQTKLVIKPKLLHEQENYFLLKTIRQKYGEFGTEVYEIFIRNQNSKNKTSCSDTLEKQEYDFDHEIKKYIQL